MTEPTPDLPQNPVTLADIQTALARKWTSGCPMCGGMKWKVRALARIPAEGYEGEVYVTGSFVPVSCEKCGATQMVDLETLLRVQILQVLQ